MEENVITPKNIERVEAISWRAHEHSTEEKSMDWFVAVAVITVSSVVSAIIFNNILFAILIVVIALTLVLFAVRKPSLVNFSLTESNLIINNKKYPYNSLSSFWIAEGNDERDKLIIHGEGFLLHHLTIPINPGDGEEIRDFLIDYLIEEEIDEPFSIKFMEYIGF